MYIHIRNSKRNKDRYVPLPEATRLVLRNYYKTHKNPTFIFPKVDKKTDIKTTNLHMSETSVQYAIKATIKESGIKQNIPVNSTAKLCFLALYNMDKATVRKK